MSLVPAAGADKHGAASTQSGGFLPAVPNFSPLGNRGAEEKKKKKLETKHPEIGADISPQGRAY